MSVDFPSPLSPECGLRDKDKCTACIVLLIPQLKNINNRHKLKRLTIMPTTSNGLVYLPTSATLVFQTLYLVDWPE